MGTGFFDFACFELICKFLAEEPLLEVIVDLDPGTGAFGLSAEVIFSGPTADSKAYLCSVPIDVLLLMLLGKDRMVSNLGCNLLAC